MEAQTISQHHSADDTFSPISNNPPPAIIILCREEFGGDFLHLLEDKLQNEKYRPVKVLCIYFQIDGDMESELIHFKSIYPHLMTLQLQNTKDTAVIESQLKSLTENNLVYWVSGKDAFRTLYGIKMVHLQRDEYVHDFLISEGDENTIIPYPSRVTLTLTEKCNYRCFFCGLYVEDFGWDPVPGPDISLDDLNKLIPVIKHAQLIDITPFRGEPLLYKHLREFLHLVYQYNQSACLTLTTNGSLLTDEISALLARNLSSIWISINAATKETYEQDMGNGNWDNIVERIRGARKHIPREKIFLSFVGNGSNIVEFPKLVKFAAELDVGHVRLQHIITHPHAIRKSLWFCKELTNQMIAQACELGRELNIDVIASGFCSDPQENREDLVCTWPTNQMLVRLNGEVYPCCYAGRHSMGNVYLPAGFEAVWNGKKYQKLRRIRFLDNCKRCLTLHGTDWIHCNIDTVTNVPGLPRISAVVIPQNNAAWLEKALMFLSKQTYSIWEAFVLQPEDMTSPVSAVTAKFAKKDGRIRPLSATDSNTYGAINQALQQSTGALFTLLSPEAVPRFTHLESLLKTFEAQGKPYVVLSPAESKSESTVITDHADFGDNRIVFDTSALKVAGGFNSNSSNPIDEVIKTLSSCL